MKRPALRKIIKAHRGFGGLDRHSRAYAVPCAEAVSLGIPKVLGIRPDALPEWVILCADDDLRTAKSADPEAVGLIKEQAVFHARVHVVLEAKFRDDESSVAQMRARVHALGQVEFDEVRDALREDDAVLAPADERATYVEFAASYFEYFHFAPDLIDSTFPSLRDTARVLGVLRQDCDDAELLEAAVVSEGPRSIRSAKAGGLSVGYNTHLAHAKLARSAKVTVSDSRAKAHLVSAAARTSAEDDASAMLDCAVAACASDSAVVAEAERLLADAAARLEKRLLAAAGVTNLSIRFVLVLLARLSTKVGRYAPEGRALFALQRAVRAFERAERVVDIAGAAASLGRAKVVRPVPIVRSVRCYRALRDARTLGVRARLEFDNRALLLELLDALVDAAEDRIRVELRPRIAASLDRASIRPESAPERAARDKVIEELLDEVGRRGFLSFGSVRDALSRNQLKFPDLGGVRSFFGTDPLLELDRCLAIALDGVYQTSDIYLRWMHLLGRALFANVFGRTILLTLIVPLGGAYTLLEAYAHLVLPHVSQHSVLRIAPLARTSVGVTALFVFGMLHSPGLRRALGQFFGLFWLLLGFIFVSVPRFLFKRTKLDLLLARPGARHALRVIAVPSLVALLVARALFRRHLLNHAAVGPLAIGAVALALLLWSRLGERLDELIFEQILPSGNRVGKRLLFGVGRVIADLFQAILDGIEGALHRVEELLRARGEEGPFHLLWKGAAGLLFAWVAYVIRLYVTVMIEPEVNPIKHVPVVTVAHKLTLPIMPDLLHTLQGLARPLGPVVGGTIAAVTAFFAPSAFGFFAWELKETYKLYRGSRGRGLAATVIGAHGETMRGLLLPGFHSGTLPKVFRRLRRAAAREHAEALQRILAGTDVSKVGAKRSLRGLRAEISTLEQRVRGFVMRDFCGLLLGATRWEHGRVDVRRVEVSPSRIRVKLRCAGLGGDDCVIAFEAQSERVIATLEEPGFVHALLARGGDSVTLFENALFGLYHAAEVDFVREQVEANIPRGRRYDFDDRGIVVWPTTSFDVELRFAVADDDLAAIEPEVVGVGMDEPSWVLDLRKVSFTRSMVGWTAWVAAWSAAEHRSARIPRLTLGSSLLQVGASGS